MPLSRRRWTQSCPRWSPVETKERSELTRLDDARSPSGIARTIQCSSWHTATAVSGRTRLHLMTFSKRSLESQKQLRLLRDGQEVTGRWQHHESRACSTGSFDQAIEEFLNKKEALADYFDDARPRTSSLTFRSRKVLLCSSAASSRPMVDRLGSENPGIFKPERIFADLFSTADCS